MTTLCVEPRWVCCGMPLPDSVGKYGCPNCCGENEAELRHLDEAPVGQNQAPQKAREGSAR